MITFRAVEPFIIYVSTYKLCGFNWVEFRRKCLMLVNVLLDTNFWFHGLFTIMSRENIKKDKLSRNNELYFSRVLGGDEENALEWCFGDSSIKMMGLKQMWWFRSAGQWPSCFPNCFMFDFLLHVLNIGSNICDSIVQV